MTNDRANVSSAIDLIEVLPSAQQIGLHDEMTSQMLTGKLQTSPAA